MRWRPTCGRGRCTVTRPAEATAIHAPVPAPVEELAERLLRRIEPLSGELLLVVTGAGVSRASGIPTFRGPEPEAVWRQDDVELATRAMLERDPLAQWSWYLRRFERLEAARPNPAHRALAELERWQEKRDGELLLVTQNIDTLHEQGGSRRLIKVHGSSDRLRCSRDGCLRGAPTGSLPRTEVDLGALRRETARRHLPACAECGALLRAHVLFFDESYDSHADYRFFEVLEAAERAALMLFVGTSFAVGITDLLLGVAARRRVPRLAIDPAAGRYPALAGIEGLAATAEELLPALCSRLDAGAG